MDLPVIEKLNCLVNTNDVQLREKIVNEIKLIAANANQEQINEIVSNLNFKNYFSQLTSNDT